MEMIQNLINRYLKGFFPLHSMFIQYIFLQHLQAPLKMTTAKARFLKLKAVKLCIFNQFIHFFKPVYVEGYLNNLLGQQLFIY